MYQTVQCFIQSKIGVLCVTVFKYFAQFYCNDTAQRITTYVSDDVHFLHAFHL